MSLDGRTDLQEGSNRAQC